jgi:hypothetical protein
MNFETNNTQRATIAANGQVGINVLAPNIEPNAQLDVHGPIFCSTPGSFSAIPIYTVLAANTTVNGATFPPIRDGFRLEYHHNFFGNNEDAMVLNKTDGDQICGDGGIAFTNEGNNGVYKLSMAISEVGRAYIGSNTGLYNSLATRLTIDANLTSTTGVGCNILPHGLPDAAASGLRFQQLNANSATVPNQGNMGVLALNTTGDVIYVPGGSGGGFFTCGTSNVLDRLPSNSWWELNKFNFNFNGNGSGNVKQNNVGVGMPCNTPACLALDANTAYGCAAFPLFSCLNSCDPVAKLEVVQSSGAFKSIGEKILNTDGDGIGLLVNTSNSLYSIVVPPGSYENTGFNSGHRVLIGRNVPLFLINGNNPPVPLLYVGNAGDGTSIQAGSFIYFSDSILKTNVVKIPNALNAIRNIRGVTFNWINTGLPDIGFIAQELERQVPRVVGFDSLSNIKTADYAKVVPLTVEAIKQLDSAVTVLQNQSAGVTGSGATLWQNFSNPLGDETVIRYFVPEKTTSANIVFYDEFGNELKNMDLPYKGTKAELKISTPNLASGVYSYSLIVNGKIIDTKKMVKNK